MIIKGDQIVSIAEARKLLGDEAKDMTDEEVRRLIEDFDTLAQYTIKLVQKFKKNNK